MSLKSRRKAENLEPNRTKASPLALQKDMIHWSMMQYLSGFFFLTLALILTTVVIFIDNQKLDSTNKLFMLLPWIIMGSISLYYILSFFRRLSLYRRIKEIPFATEEIITIDCKKVRTFKTPVGRYSSVSTYMILEDTAGKRYYYIHPRKNKNSWIHISFDIMVKGKQLRLICYQNTNLVKFPPQGIGEPHLQNESGRPQQRRET